MAVDALARSLAAGKVPVDAYEMAVAGGYTGTKEQFEADLGQSGTNATNAANSAAAAAASATTASNAASNFAPTYSTSATYAVGDYVLYNSGLYECNTAITTAEAWTAAHWTAKKLAPEVAELKTQLGEITGNESIPVTATGAYIDLHTNTTNLDGPTTSSTASYLIAQCSAGDQFIISTVGGGNARAYGFVGDNRTTVISRAAANLTCDKVLVTAPENAAYLVVNAVTSHTITVIKNNLLVNRVSLNERNIDAVIERIAKTFLLSVLDDAVQTITASDDLNDFLTVGNYKKTTTSGAPSHCPVGNSIAFGLKIMQIAASTTYCQILVPAAPSTGYLWYRLIGTSGGSPSYGDWHKIADERNTFVHNPTIITASNVTTYFPNSSFNDAKPNTIFGIAEYIDVDGTPVIHDGPPGDQVYGVPVNQGDTPASPVKGWGARRGTLLTYSQALGNDDASGLVQIFVQYPGYKNYYGATSPSICFRIAYYENDAYTWSDWSKLAERGVLHAGNGIIYGGQPYIDHAPFTDLNDAPWNSIFHADRNMDGSDEYHTLTHHPTPGESCMITTYAFSPDFDHCRKQVVNSLSGRELWRYEYAQNGTQWTDWYEVIHNRGVLGEDANFNARKSNGIWYVKPQSEGDYSNNPLTDAGYLIVHWNDNAGFQRAESLTGERYIRHWDDSTSAWTAWTYDDDGSVIRNKGRLANNSDLNDVQENGVWLLGGQSGAQYVNNPIMGAGYLTVKWNNNIGLQVIEALAGTRYSRYTENGGATWSNWV